MSRTPAGVSATGMSRRPRVRRVRLAPPHAGALVQPVLRQREGQRGERRRLPATQSHGPQAARRILRTALAPAVGTIRGYGVDGREFGRPWLERSGQVRTRPWRVGAVAVPTVRRCVLSQPQGGQIRARRVRVQPLPGRGR